ncbi:MAG: hypothetical protein Q9169_005450 [Polycauliona sp. 2 TL-2023]
MPILALIAVTLTCLTPYLCVCSVAPPGKIVPPGKLINQYSSNWDCEVDSWERVSGTRDCAKAYDGDDDTWWHTEYAVGSFSASLPHTFDIDLGQEYSVSGLTYLPRQDGGRNGNIGQYEISLTKLSSLGSLGPDTTGPIPRTDFEGVWLDDSERKAAIFPATLARYIRLKAITEAGDRGPWSCIAQLDIYDDPDNDTSCDGGPCPDESQRLPQPGESSGDSDDTNNDDSDSSDDSADPPPEPVTVTATRDQPITPVVTVSETPPATLTAKASMVTNTVSAATASSDGPVTVTSIQPAPTSSQAGAPAAAVDSSIAVMGKVVDPRVVLMGLVAAVGILLMGD